jgi:GTPase
MNFTVAIVGRPNVGKSTLFNRLTETSEAIVEPTAGVTRDRKYGESNWGNKNFIIIDTGGVITDSSDQFENDINGQVNIAVEEANLVLFLVDVRDGLTEWDINAANLLRKANKKIIVVVNKVDTLPNSMPLGWVNTLFQFLQTTDTEQANSWT